MPDVHDDFQWCLRNETHMRCREASEAERVAYIAAEGEPPAGHEYVSIVVFDTVGGCMTIGVATPGGICAEEETLH